MQLESVAQQPQAVSGHLMTLPSSNPRPTQEAPVKYVGSVISGIREFSLAKATPILLTVLLVAAAIYALQYHEVIPAPGRTAMQPPLATTIISPPAHPSDDVWENLEAQALEETKRELALMTRSEVQKMTLEDKHRMCLRRLIRLTAEWCLKQEGA